MYLTPIALLLADELDHETVIKKCAMSPDPAGLMRQVFELIALSLGFTPEEAEDSVSQWTPMLIGNTARVERGRELSGSLPNEYLYGSFARPIEAPPSLSPFRMTHLGAPRDDQTAWGYIRTLTPLPDSVQQGYGLIMLSTPQDGLGAGLHSDLNRRQRPTTTGETWLLHYHLAFVAEEGEAQSALEASA